MYHAGIRYYTLATFVHRMTLDDRIRWSYPKRFRCVCRLAARRSHRVHYIPNADSLIDSLSHSILRLTRLAFILITGGSGIIEAAVCTGREWVSEWVPSEHWLQADLVSGSSCVAASWAVRNRYRPRSTEEPPLLIGGSREAVGQPHVLLNTEQIRGKTQHNTLHFFFCSLAALHSGEYQNQPLL